MDLGTNILKLEIVFRCSEEERVLSLKFNPWKFINVTASWYMLQEK